MKIGSARATTARACASAVLTVVLALAAGCAGSAAGGGPVQLRFWSWVPGADTAVNLFNRTHHDVHVTLDQIPAGAEGGYAKMHSAVKSGRAPCLAQVEFQEVPSFLLDRELMDVSRYLTAYDRRTFPESAWSLTRFEGGTWAIPQATGPMGLYYRADLFTKWGIKVPATWDEYRTAAERIHRADPKAYATTIPSTDPKFFVGLAWQAGAHWMRTDGDAWHVDIPDAPTVQVARYWQDLIERGLTKVSPWFTPSWFKDVSDGRLVALPAPQWAEAIMAASAPSTVGKWRLAPMPVWRAGQRNAAVWGGSTTAVLAGCDHPRQAVEFGLWLNRDPGSVSLLIKGGYGWPAATSGTKDPALTSPSKFLGGQRSYPIFSRSDVDVPPGWIWWPSYSVTNQVLGDGLLSVGKGGDDLVGVLRRAQRETVRELKAKGLRVEGGDR